MFLAPLVWLLLPGYALLPSRLNRRLQLPFVLGVSFLATSALGLGLLFLGWFKPWLLTVILLGFIPVGALRGGFRRIHLRSWLPLLAFIPIVAGAMLWHGEPYQGACDAGVYVASAFHLKDAGRYDWPAEELLPSDPAARNLSIRTTPYQFPWKEIWPGIILLGKRAVPQFFPLYPAWMALFIAAFGLSGILLTNAVFFLLALLMLSLLGRLFLPARFAWIAPLMIALNPGVFYFLRYPSAEIFLAFILTGFAAFLVYGLALRSELLLELAAGFLAAGLAAKYMAWFLLAPLAVIWVLDGNKRWFLKWFGLPFILAGLFPAACLLAYNYPHWMNHFLPNERLMEGGAFLCVLAVLGLASRLAWIRRRTAGMVGIAFAVVVLAFLFVLPHAVERGEENVMPELIWYTGWGWFILGMIGFGVALFKEKRGAGPMIIIFLLMLLASLAGTSDNPLHPFAFRRHIPVLLPMMGLFAALAVHWLRHIGKTALIVGMLLCILPPLWSGRNLIRVREGRGFPSLKYAISEPLLDETIYCINSPPGSPWPKAILQETSPHFCAEDLFYIASQSALWDGAPIFPLHLDTEEALLNFQHYAQQKGPLILLSKDQLSRSCSGIVPHAETESLQPERNRLPNRIVMANTSIYSCTISLESVRAEEYVAVGGEDFGRIAGFWGPEKDGERPFRWTKDWCHFILQTRDKLVLSMDSSGNPENPVPFRIYAGKEMIVEDAAPPGWRDYTYPVPQKYRARMVAFSLVTHTFQPYPDTRNLGLKISAILSR
jgi:hypothetical protein